MFYEFDISSITNFFKLSSFKINDIIEILIIIFIIYQLLKSLKGTRAWIVAKGTLILFLLYGISYFLSFKIITYLAGLLFTFFSVALVIMFQPELRKLLEKLGNKNLTLRKFFKKIKKEKTEDILYSNKSIEEIIKSVNVMSKAKTGALILIEKDMSLIEYENTGIVVNADISNQLITNIFEKNTPLHDGAMIIRGDKITAATCYLPLSDNRNIDKNLGTRHRAAIGASEETDALIIVVSEETGAISIVKNGKIKHNITIEKLREELVDNRVKSNQDFKKSKKITNNKIKLWILSVLFGAFLWLFITDMLDPIVTVKIQDIPVQVINAEKLLDTGYVYEIKDGKTVDISVNGRKSAVDSLTKNDFKAVADASEISITNSMNIKVTALKNSSELEINTNNSLTTISLEETTTLECSVITEKTGTETEGYYVSQLVPSVKTISITGAKSKLKTIEKAVAQIDVSNKTEDFDMEVNYSVYDKNGNIVDLSDCTINTDKINVACTVLKTKEVPIKISAIDSSLENCTVNTDSVKLSNDTVIISAPDDILDNINEINVTVDVAKSTTNKINSIIDMKNYMPDGVYFADTKSELTVNMNIQRIITKDIEIQPSDITIKNGNGEIINNTYKATIQYDYENKDNVSIDKLKPYIDISNLYRGNHYVEIAFEDTSKITVLNTDKIKVYVHK